MSKHSNFFDENNNNYYQSIFGCELNDEDEFDEDYNVVEDILTNKYNYEEEPIHLSIPKKEVNDVNYFVDKLELIKSDDEFSNSFLSKKISRNNNNNHKNLDFNINNNNNNSNNSDKNNNSFNLDNQNIKKKTSSNSNNNISFKKNNNNKHTKNEKNFSPILNKTNDDLFHIENYNKDKINNSNNNNNIYNINNNNNNSINLLEDNNIFYKKIPISYEKNIINQMDIFEKINLLIKQYDLMIQLLIQNLFMCENKNLKLRCYSILFSFYLARQRFIDTYQISNFNISFNFNQIFYINEIYKNMNIKFQYSFFQSPILDILPIITQFVNKKIFTKEETIKILKEFFPFINPLYLPIFNNKFKHNKKFINHNNNNNNNIINEKSKIKKFKKKFSIIDDNLLLIGLRNHGKKNLNYIQQLWLPFRTIEEIKNRIKNLTCNSAPQNIIKKNKILNETMLNIDEFYLFIKGLEWFGFKNKFNLISRYFLPERNSEFLENFFNLMINYKIFPEFMNNNDKLNFDKINNSNEKKFFINIDEELLKEYKNKYSKEINNIKNEINNLDSKSYFYTKENFYEKIDINNYKKNKKDENRINTRNKNKNINEKKNINNKKNNNVINNNLINFELANFDDGTFEKIEI